MASGFEALRDDRVCAGFGRDPRLGKGRGGRKPGDASRLEPGDEAGRKDSRRWIQLDEPIKQLGEYKVPVRLHREVTVEVKVVVAKEE